MDADFYPSAMKYSLKRNDETQESEYRLFQLKAALPILQI
jgi:hypothetical protein